MKNEIKEIVRRMNDLIEHQFDKEYHTKCDLFKDIQSLLDNITNLQKYYNDIVNKYEELLVKYSNLQEENEYLKKQNDEITKIGIADHKYASQKEDEAIVLQEENKVLKHKLEQMYNNTKDTYNEICAEQVDYKSRCYKAIEYNYELQERYCHSALFDDLVASKIYEITEKQLNILQGSDNND